MKETPDTITKPPTNKMPTLPNYSELLCQLLDHENRRRNIKPGLKAYTETSQQIEALRGQLPTALLSHYDARRSRGKAPIARVVNGVCRSCFISLPRGRISELNRSSAAVHLCENCGSFIYLDDGEAVSSRALKAAPSTPSPTTRKRISTEEK